MVSDLDSDVCENGATGGDGGNDEIKNTVYYKCIITWQIAVVVVLLTC